MKHDAALLALSPLDGRYRSQTEELSHMFSEYALMKYRLYVEITYFIFFHQEIMKKPLTGKQKTSLLSCIGAFDEHEAEKVKEIERTTRHDVKSIEYYLREKMNILHIPGTQYIHFGLTSEDVNNLSYSLMVKEVRDTILVPAIANIVTELTKMIQLYGSCPMLARTHGQPAIPTTMGKELLVFALRLKKELHILKNLPIEGKFNGAVGNFSAMVAGYPSCNWMKITDRYIASLHLVANRFTTQILPYDSYIRIFQSLHLINVILIGFDEDMWRYISDGYFVQRMVNHEIGSSTMPQKINPIDFENSEGNLGLANALLLHFMQKFPISRLQRDLSDSTVKRSIGSAFGYCLLGYDSCTKGLGKIQLHKALLRKELSAHWEVVTEGIQTILRAHGDEKAYEKLKEFSRGKNVTNQKVKRFVSTLPVSVRVKKQLLRLTPMTYIGLSKKLVDEGLDVLRKEPI